MDTGGKSMRSISIRVEYPQDHVGVLESSDHIHVEQDSEVKTQ